MWSTRLAEAVRRAGAQALRLADTATLAVAIEAHEVGDEPGLDGAIVDVGARGFDAVAAIEHIHGARLPVIAVAQHDDQLTRRRAIRAGASRVFSYQRFFTDGPRLVEGWLAASGRAASGG
jgi:DNA-binding NarL/FixJ family response regulator